MTWRLQLVLQNFTMEFKEKSISGCVSSGLCTVLLAVFSFTIPPRSDQTLVRFFNKAYLKTTDNEYLDTCAMTAEIDEESSTVNVGKRAAIS